MKSVDDRQRRPRCVEEFADSPKDVEDSAERQRIDALHMRPSGQRRGGSTDRRLVHRAHVALFLGQDQLGPEFFQQVDIQVIERSLLFGDQGKPTDEIDEDAFFAIVGALIAPRLATIEQLIVRDDVRKLEAELASIKALY